MRERRRRPDLDERFTVPPMEGEDLLRRLLEPSGEPCEDEEAETEEP